MDYTLAAASSTPTNNNLFSAGRPLFPYQPLTSATNSRKQNDFHFEQQISTPSAQNPLTQSAEYQSNNTSHLAKKNINMQQFLLTQPQPSPHSHQKPSNEIERERLSASSYLYKTQNLSHQFKPFHPSGNYSSQGNNNILISGAGNLGSSARKDNQQTPLSSKGQYDTQFVLTPKDFYHGSQRHNLQSRDNSSIRDNISSLIIPDNNMYSHPLNVMMQTSDKAKHTSRSLSRSNNTQAQDQPSLNRTQFSINPSYSAQNPSFVHSQATTSNPHQHLRPHLSNQAFGTDSFVKNSQNIPLQSQPLSSSLASQNDMELIIMGLHEKMQNLESKYLDLANYYKREMVKKSNSTNPLPAPVHSSSSQSFFPQPVAHQSALGQIQSSSNNRNLSTERSVSPIRIDNYYYSPQHNPSQAQSIPPPSRERDIISELFKDKQELEQALQNMLQLQNLMQDKHSHLQSRLKSVEKEKQAILQEKAELQVAKNKQYEDILLQIDRNQSHDNNREIMDLMDSLQQQTNQAIEQIENNLLLLMSSGFQELSEGDLIDNFANLKIEFEKIVESLRVKLMRRKQSSRLSVNDLQTLNPTFAAPSSQQKQPVSHLGSPISRRQNEKQLAIIQDLENSNEENQQLQQRAIFDIQNLHNLSKLEVRKIQIAASQLQKVAKEIKQDAIKYQQAEKSNVNSTRSGITIHDQRSALIGIINSQNSGSLGQQQVDMKLLESLTQHIQVITQSSQGLSQKQKDEDLIITQLQDCEVIAAANFKELKSRCEKIIQDCLQEARNFSNSPIQSLNHRSHSQKKMTQKQEQSQQTYETLKSKLKSLKYQNADLQDQIALKSLDIQQLEGQNRQLLQRMSDLEHQLSTHMQLKSSTEENQDYSDSNLYPSTSAQKQMLKEVLPSENQRVKQQLLFNYTQADGTSLDEGNSQILSPQRQREKIIASNSRQRHERSHILDRSQDSDARSQQNSARNIEVDQLANAVQNLQQQLATIQEENSGLVRQIRTLHRTVNEKNEQIEKLGSEMQALGSHSKNRKYSEDELKKQLQSRDESLATLIQVVQEFLQAMKKLQRAVHSQQRSVQDEKTYFEKCKKELEQALKQIKKGQGFQPKIIQDAKIEDEKQYFINDKDDLETEREAQDAYERIDSLELSQGNKFQSQLISMKAISQQQSDNQSVRQLNLMALECQNMAIVSLERSCKEQLQQVEIEPRQLRQHVMRSLVNIQRPQQQFNEIQDSNYQLQEQQISDLRIQCEDLMKEKERAAAKFKTIEQSMSQKISSLEGERKELRHENLSLQDQIQELTSQLEEQGRQLSQVEGGKQSIAQLLQTERNNINQLKSELKRAQDSTSQLRTEVEDERSRAEAQAEECKELVRKLEEASQAMKKGELLHKEQLKLIEQQLKKDVVRLQGEMRDLESEKVDLQKERDDFENQLVQSREQLRGLESKLKDREAKCKEQERVMRLKEQELESIKVEMKNARQTFQEAEALNQELQSEIESQITSLRSTQEELKRSKESGAKLKQESRELASQLQQSRSQTEECEGKLNEVMSKFQSATQNLQAVEQDALALKADKERLLTLESTLKSQQEILLIENEGLRHKLESLESTLSQIQDSKVAQDSEVQSFQASELRRVEEERDKYRSQLQAQIKLKNELERAKQSLEDESRDLRQSEREVSKLLEEKQFEIQGLKDQVDTLRNESNSYQQEVESFVNELKTKIQVLEGENNDLKQQLSQSQLQLESFNGEITSAQDSLQQSEKICLDLKDKLTTRENENKSLNVMLTHKSNEIVQLEAQYEQILESVQHFQKENSRLESEMETLREQLSSNQLMKGVEKQQDYAQQVVQTGEQLRKKESECELLKQSIKALKTSFEERLLQFDEKNTALELELAMQKELVEDAKKLIEEVQLEKDQLKQRLKNLMELIYRDINRRSNVGGDGGARSSEMENEPEDFKLQTIIEDIQDDPDLDIEHYLDRLEAEITQNLRKKALVIKSLSEMNLKLRQELDSFKVENEEREGEAAAAKKKYEDVEIQLQQALSKIQANDSDMKKQLDLASRKVQNYRDKVIQKQKQINCLEQEKRELQQSKVDIMLRSGIASPVNNSIREIELLQRLQKAEAELQTYRLAGLQMKPGQQSKQEKRRRQTGHSGMGSDDGGEDNSIKVDESRIEQMEDQLQSLRGQIFTAKEQVVQKLSETFGKQIKEIVRTFQNEKLLASRLNQITSDQQLKAVFNNQIKVLKVFHLPSSPGAQSLSPEQRMLLIIQQVVSQELSVIDTQSLSPASLTYLLSYLPQNMAEVQFQNLIGHIGGGGGSDSFSPKQRSSAMQEMSGGAASSDVEKQLARLEEKIAEVREERQELQQELAIYRNKLSNGKGFEGVDLEMIEREDDIDSLNDKNQQMRIKIKQMAEDNLLLKHRLLEQNELIKAFSLPKQGRPSSPGKSKEVNGSNGQSRQAQEEVNSMLLKLRDENDQLKYQLSEMEQQNEELQAAIELLQGNQRSQSGLQLPATETQILRQQNEELRRFTDQELNEGSFLNGIEEAQAYGIDGKTVAAAQGTGQDQQQQLFDSQLNQDGANDMLDQSSLYGAILEGMEGAPPEKKKSSVQQAKASKTSKGEESKAGNYDQLNRMRVENQELREEVEQLQQALEKLEINNEELNRQIQQLQDELSEKEQKLLLNPDSSVMLSNIKGTLFQYLRGCPQSDRASEPLLEVVMSQMGYSKEEVEDLKTFRRKGRDASVSGNLSKQEEDNGGSRSRKAAGNAGGAIGGLFGNLLRRKDGGSKEQSLVRGNSASQINPSPMRPLQRK